MWRMRIGCRTKCRFDLRGSINPKRPWKMGPIGCPETSVTNYHHTPRNIPEERRSRMCDVSTENEYSYLVHETISPFIDIIGDDLELASIEGSVLIVCPSIP